MNNRSVSRFALRSTTAIALALHVSSSAWAQEGRVVLGENRDITVTNARPVTSPGLTNVDPDFGTTNVGVGAGLTVNDGQSYTATVVQNGDVTLSDDGDLFGVSAIAETDVVFSGGGTTSTGTTSASGPQPLFIGPGIAVPGEAFADVNVVGDTTLTHRDTIEGGQANGVQATGSDGVAISVEGDTGVRSSTGSAIGVSADTSRGDAVIDVDGSITASGNRTFDGGGSAGAIALSGTVINGPAAIIDPGFLTLEGGDSSITIDGDIDVSAGANEAFGAVAVSDGTATLSVTGDTVVSGASGFGLAAAGSEEATVEVTGDVTLDVQQGIDGFDLLPSALADVDPQRQVDTAVGAASANGTALVILNDSTISSSIVDGSAVAAVSAFGDAEVTGSGQIDSAGRGILVESFSGARVDFTGSVAAESGENSIGAGIAASAIEGDIAITVAGDEGDAIMAVGDDTDGINASLARSGAITVENGVSITTDGADSSGIRVNALGLSTTTAGAPSSTPPPAPMTETTVVNTGDITTNGDDSEGIVIVNPNGNVTVTNEADITTTGGNGIEVIASGVDFGTFQPTGEGDIVINSRGAIQAGAGTENSEKTNAIFASANRGDITVTSDGDLSGSGDAVGLFIFEEGDITLTSEGDIASGSSDGRNDDAIIAVTNMGDIEINSTGSLTAQGEFSEGIVAGVSARAGDLSAEGDVTVTSEGRIETMGDFAEGIDAFSERGNVTVTHTGDIVTAGTGSEAVSVGVEEDGGAGNVSAIVIGNIVTGGETDTSRGGRGISAFTPDGDATASLTGSAMTAATGVRAAVFAPEFDANNAETGGNIGRGNATATFTGQVIAKSDGSGDGPGTIAVTGDNVDGVLAFTGIGNATATVTGDVTTTGTNSDTVVAATTGGTARTTVTGDVTATGDTSFGVGAVARRTTPTTANIAIATTTGGVVVSGNGTTSLDGATGVIVSEAGLTTTPDSFAVGALAIGGGARATLTGTANVANARGVVAQGVGGDASATLTMAGDSTTGKAGVEAISDTGKATALLNGEGSLTSTGGAGVVAAGETASATVSITSGSTLAAARDAVSVTAENGDATVTVTNAGTITGARALAVSADSGTVAVTNSGAIAGDIDTASAGTTDTVTNRGTMTGDIKTGAAADSLTLVAGSSLTGNVALGAGDDMVSAAAGTFSGRLDGGADTDALTLTGGGRVVFSRIVNFESTDLVGARFTAAGAGNGPTNVRSGATLAVASVAGTGDLVNEGDVEIADGATLSTGDYTAESGSTTDIGLSAETSGTIEATGTVDFQSGSAVALTVAPDADIAEGKTFIIASGSAVTDASTLTDDSVLFKFTKAVTGGNTLVLTSERELIFADNTPDDAELTDVGSALDTAIEQDPALRAGVDAALRNGVTEDEVLADLAPPDNFAEVGAVKAATAQRSGVISDRITGRLSSGAPGGGNAGLAPSGDGALFSTSVADSPAFAASMDATGVRSRGVGVWAKGYFGEAEQDATASSGGFDADTYGAAVGVDYRTPGGMIIGVAGAYGSTDADLTGASAGDSVDATSLTGILYGGIERGPVLVEGQVFYGVNDYNGSSLVLGNRLTSDYDGTEYGAGLRASYTIDAGNGVAVAPEVGLTYTRLSTDAYSETGVGARRFEDADFDSILGYLGARVSADYVYGTTRLTPQIRFGVEHEFDGDYEQVASFSAGGAPFTITNDDRDETRFRFGAGVELAVSERVALGLDYDGAFASDYEEHGGSVQVRIKF